MTLIGDISIILFIFIFIFILYLKTKTSYFSKLKQDLKVYKSSKKTLTLLGMYFDVIKSIIIIFLIIMVLSYGSYWCYSSVSLVEFFHELKDTIPQDILSIFIILLFPTLIYIFASLINHFSEFINEESPLFILCYFVFINLIFMVSNFIMNDFLINKVILGELEIIKLPNEGIRVNKTTELMLFVVISALIYFLLLYAVNIEKMYEHAIIKHFGDEIVSIMIIILSIIAVSLNEIFKSDLNSVIFESSSNNIIISLSFLLYLPILKIMVTRKIYSLNSK